MDKIIPGTDRPYKDEDAFADFRKAIELTDGLSLGQICSICDLDPCIIQNWVKRGYVARPAGKKYYEKHFARILLINSLKEAMKIEDIGRLMTLVNGDVEDESDDLLSEAELYGLFAKVVYRLDGDDVEDTIRQVMDSVNMNDDKLFTALEVMVYAWLSGEHRKISRRYLKVLETYRN